MTIDLPRLGQKKPLELKHLAKSAEGLWIKTEVLPNEIGVFAHSRHKHVGDKFIHISPDGDVSEENPVIKLCYDDPWIKIGSVPTNRIELHALCDVVKFDVLLWGISRHIAQLIALGWGENISEIPEWFLEPEKGIGISSDWEYLIVGPFWAPFHEEFNGCYFTDAMYVDGVLSGSIHISGKEYEFKSNDIRDLGAFYVSAMPVDTPSNMV